MSQYTISLNELVKIHYPETIANISLKIEKLRYMLFNYDYGVNDEFKEKFERAFILHYIESDINNYDVDLWLAKLQIAVELKAPLYFERYKAVKNLKADYIAQMTTTIYSDNSEHTSKGESKGKSNNKSKSSQFPQDIVNSNDFDKINYMDSGSASISESEGESVINDTNAKKSQTLVIGNAIDKIRDFDNVLNDEITNLINELNFLFMLIY